MNAFNWKSQPSETADAIAPSKKARPNSRHVLTLVPGGINGSQKRAVEQLTSDGEVVRWFQSISHAAREMGVSYTSIKRAITGRTKKCCGHPWRYAKRATDPAGDILRDRFGGAYSKAVTSKGAIE